MNSQQPSLRSNAVWALLEKTIRGLVVFIYLALITEHYSVAHFGNLSYAISIQFIVYTVINFGLDRVFVREMSRCEASKIGLIVQRGFKLKIILAFIFILISLLLLMTITDENGGQILVLLSVCVLIFRPANIVEHYLHSQFLIRTLCLIQISGVLVSLVGVLLFCFGGYEFEYIALVLGLEWLIVSICFLFVYKRHFKKNVVEKNSHREELIIFAEWLKYGFPLLLSSVGFILLFRIDQIMIKHMLSVEELGQYAIALRFSEALTLVPVVINTICFPRIVRLVNERSDLLVSYLKSILGLLYCYTLVVTIFSLFAFDSLIAGIISENSELAQRVFKIHVFWLVFICSGLIVSSVQIAQDNQKYIFYRSIIALFLNIALNLVLIPEYGVAGAAVASVLSYAFANFLLVGLVSQTPELFYIMIAAMAPRWMLCIPKNILFEKKD